MLLNKNNFLRWEGKFNEGPFTALAKNKTYNIPFSFGAIQLPIADLDTSTYGVDYGTVNLMNQTGSAKRAVWDAVNGKMSYYTDQTGTYTIQYYWRDMRGNNSNTATITVNVLSGLSAGGTLANRSVAIMGNSISNPNRGANNPNAAQLYWGLLKSQFNWVTDVDAISGTTIVPFGTGDNFSADVRINGFATRGFNPEFILIEAGTNDFGDGRVVIGSNANAENNVFGTATFYSALKYLYNHLRTTYPNAIIFHVEPLQRADKGYPSINNGKLLTDFVAAINAVAPNYGVNVIHAFANSGLTSANMVAGGTYSIDGLHPNAAGHAVLADYIKTTLLAFLNV